MRLNVTSLLFAIVVLLAWTLEPAQAHHGLFHKIFHGIGHAIKETVHGIETVVKKEVHVVKEIEHGIVHVADEVVHGVVHVIEDVAHAAAKVLKAVVKIVNVLQADLLKLNDKLFGPFLGPILDKLEMMAIEGIPVVGQVVKIVIEGEDIADQVSVVKKCWSTRDFSCVGHAVGSIVSDVSAAKLDRIGHMGNFANAVAKGGQFVENACTVAEDVTDTYDSLKDVVEVVKDKGNMAQVAEALVGLGGVLGNVDKSLSGLSASQQGVWKNVATALDRGVKVVQQGETFVLGGVKQYVDVANALESVKTCIAAKDFSCAGDSVATITGAVAKDLEWVDPNMAAFANQLTHIGGTVSNVGHEVAGTYSAYLGLKDAAASFSLDSLTDAENSVKALGGAMRDLSSSFNTLTGAKTQTFTAACDRLVNDVTAIQDGQGKVGKIIAAGVDITNSYKAAVACGHTSFEGVSQNDVEKSSAYLQCMGTAVNGMIGPISDVLGQETGHVGEILSKIQIASNTVISFGQLGSELSAEYHSIDVALLSVRANPSLDNLKSQGQAIGGALHDLAFSGKLTVLGVDGPALYNNVCAKLQKELAVITDPNNPSGVAIGVIGVALNVGQNLQNAAAAIQAKDYAQAGADLGAIFSAIGVKLDAEGNAMKGALGGVAVEIGGVSLTLANKLPAEVKRLADGYEAIRGNLTLVRQLASVEHVSAFVKALTNALGQDMVAQSLSTTPSGPALWHSLVSTLENTTVVELATDGKTVKDLYFAGASEAGLLKQLMDLAQKVLTTAGDVNSLLSNDNLSGSAVNVAVMRQLQDEVSPNLRSPARALLARRDAEAPEKRRQLGLFHKKKKRAVAPPPPPPAPTPPPTAGQMLAQLMAVDASAMVSQAADLAAVMTSFNAGTALYSSLAVQNQHTAGIPVVPALLASAPDSSSTFLNNPPMPSTGAVGYSTDADTLTAASEAYQALATAMSTAEALVQVRTSGTALSYDDVAATVYQFNEELADALQHWARFLRTDSTGVANGAATMWEEAASTIQYGLIVSPNAAAGNQLGAALRASFSPSDLMPFLMDAGTHWGTNDYAAAGYDLAKLFVVAWGQSAASATSLVQIAKIHMAPSCPVEGWTGQLGYTGGCEVVGASSLYNEFEFAFSHLSAADFSKVSQDAIPDCERHGVLRLASAINDTIWNIPNVGEDILAKYNNTALLLQSATVETNAGGYITSVSVPVDSTSVPVWGLLSQAINSWKVLAFDDVGAHIQALVWALN